MVMSHVPMEIGASRRRLRPFKRAVHATWTEYKEAYMSEYHKVYTSTFSGAVLSTDAVRHFSTVCKAVVTMNLRIKLMLMISSLCASVAANEAAGKLLRTLEQFIEKRQIIHTRKSNIETGKKVMAQLHSGCGGQNIAGQENPIGTTDQTAG